MSGARFLLYVATATIAVSATVCVPVGWVVRKRDQLFETDGVLVVAPPFVFIAASLLWNAPFQIGWGLIVYPPIIAISGALTFAFRGLVLDNLGLDPRSSSRVLCIAAIVLSLIAGIFAPPFYE